MLTNPPSSNSTSSSSDSESKKVTHLQKYKNLENVFQVTQDSNAPFRFLSIDLDEVDQISPIYHPVPASNKDDYNEWKLGLKNSLEKASQRAEIEKLQESKVTQSEQIPVQIIIDPNQLKSNKKSTRKRRGSRPPTTRLELEVSSDSNGSPSSSKSRKDLSGNSRIGRMKKIKWTRRSMSTAAPQSKYSV